MPNELGASFRKFHAAKTSSEKVIVAVKAERAMSKSALAWALAHVVRPGDCVIFLAVFSIDKTGRRFLNFPLWAGDCGSGGPEELPDRICEISESCSQMVLQFSSQVEIKVRIKVVSSSCRGAVAAEAKTNKVNWVILDKKLKQEVKYCIEDLSCNIVTMKGSEPQILRLNLGCSNEPSTPFFSALSSPGVDIAKIPSQRMNQSTPASSPDEPSTSDTRTSREDSLSSFDTINSPYLLYEENPLFEGYFGRKYSAIEKYEDTSKSLNPPNSIGEKVISLSAAPTSVISARQKSAYYIPQNHIINGNCQAYQDKRNSQTTISLIAKPSQGQHVSPSQGQHVSESNEGVFLNHPYSKDEMNSNIRDAVSLGKISSIPPPLCSICQHKTPAFGKPPRKFSYKELLLATDGFSNLNFLAKGGFGIVYRGVLRDGQVVAVKQLKCEGFQAETDFCREVRVLSCAQHRNVVLLIGFCIESTTRLLVYEYICNHSLDFHLHESRTRLDWQSRVRIAIGAARGLRYLHEDCRVGCIVHKDFRPKNILLTHDFEPLITDFGLARQHSEWTMNEDDRVIGTSGYLAPEYINGGMISHKVDVYAFGVVLLELITGRRISELKSLEGKLFTYDCYQPLSASRMNDLLGNGYQFLDSNLISDQPPDFPHQLQAMTQAASMCLRQDPELRPPMSKILRVLEGGDPTIALGLDLDSVGCRSGHLRGPPSARIEAKRSHSRKLSH